MKLTEKERSALEHMMQSNGWKVFIRLSEDYIHNIQASSSLKENEFNTLRATIDKESRVDGIYKLIQNVGKHLE